MRGTIPEPRPPRSPGRRRPGAAAALLAALFLAGATPEPAPPPPADAAERPPADAPADGVEVVTARLVRPPRPGHRDVVELRPFLRGAGLADWSAQGDWIVFDRADGEGRRDLYRVRADGTDERCLTCERHVLHRVSARDPVWHPSGEWLVFRGQELPRRLLPRPEVLATPLGGVHSELWALPLAGHEAWRLTNEGERGRAVGGAAFSHEGGRLAWSSRLATAGAGPYGQWAVRVAEARRTRGVARLGDVTTIEPARGLYEVSAFTPDDRGLFVTSDAAPGAPPAGLDVFVVDLATRTRRPVATTAGEREQNAVAVPRGGELVWASDRGLEPPRRLPYRGELWIRTWDAAAGDASPGPAAREERLTYFNDPKSDHALGEALVDDVAWSPAGDRLLLHVVSAGEGGAVEEGLWLLVLAPSYHR